MAVVLQCSGSNGLMYNVHVTGVKRIKEYHDISNDTIGLFCHCENYTV